MLKNLIAIFAMCCLLSCGGNSSSENDIEKYESTRQQLAKRETKFPAEFLTITSTNKKNLIGQTVVKGTIKNTATVTAYKKVRVKCVLNSFGKTFFKTGHLAKLKMPYLPR